MKFFKHAGGRINLDHVAEVMPFTGMAVTGLRLVFAADPNGITHTDVFGPDADRLRLILDALELVVQELPKPVAKAEPVEVADGESAEYLAVVQDGKIVNCRGGRPAIFASWSEAWDWAARRNVGEPDAQYCTVVSISLPAVAKPKPDIKGEVWVVVNKAKRTVGLATYPTRKDAESAIWKSGEYEAVQLV